jgi:hypothetical protein
MIPALNTTRANRRLTFCVVGFVLTLLAGQAMAQTALDTRLADNDWTPEDNVFKSRDAELDQPTGGNILTVGSDPGICDYLDLQAAIDSASSGDTIRLSGSSAYHSGNTYSIFTKSLTIQGGYSTCSASEPSGRTVLNADGNGRVFDIWLPPAEEGPQEVLLENLVVINGSTGGTGGGILIEGRPGASRLTLANVEVRDNETTGNGGGVGVLINGPRIQGGGAGGLILIMDSDSSIVTNTAGANGGGLACRNPSEHSIGFSNLMLLDRTSIIGNQAVNGGGLAALHCAVIQYSSGGTQAFLFTDAAISLNTASESGGGLYLDQSSANVRGTQGTTSGIPAGDANAGRIFANQAANGGGAYVTGPSFSRLSIIESIVDNNEASVDGGGIYATDGGLVRVTRLNFGNLTPCQPQQSSGGVITIPRCSRLRDNSAGRDGGAAFVDGGELEVERTIISGNEADRNGSVVTVRGESDNLGEATFDDTLVHGNSGDRLFYAWTHSDILTRWSTITDNDTTHVFRAFTNTGAARIRVAGSVIWEDGGNVLTTDGSGELVAFGECIIGHQDLAQIDANFQLYSTSDPLLIEKDETRPYFPGPTSPAIDFCHGDFYQENPDLAGSDRGTQHTGSPLTNPPPWSGDGHFDIGAYETDWAELTDALFQDRFESP